MYYKEDDKKKETEIKEREKINFYSYNFLLITRI